LFNKALLEQRPLLLLEQQLLQPLELALLFLILELLVLLYSTLEFHREQPELLVLLVLQALLVLQERQLLLRLEQLPQLRLEILPQFQTLVQVQPQYLISAFLRALQGPQELQALQVLQDPLEQRLP
jgi:hypothetical protein